MEEHTLRLLDFPSLLEYLSQFTLSEGGKESVFRLQPYRDVETLTFETELLRESLDFSQEILSGLQTFPGLEGVFDLLIQENVLDEDGLWAIALVLEQVSRIQDACDAISQERSPSLHTFFHRFDWPEKVWQGLRRCLNDDGELKDESSPELFSVRQEIRKIHHQCTRKVDEFIEQGKSVEYLQDQYLTLSADRYVLALKANFKGRMRGIIHDYSQSGETCYFEPFFLVDLNNRLQECKNRERQAKQHILEYLTTLVVGQLEKVKELYIWAVECDLLRAKICFARQIEGIPISIGEEFPVCLLQARHPLLCLSQDHVCPIDIEFYSKHRGLIISGGNSGGKTVCLKTLGLVSVMAMAALPVPVEEGSTLPLWQDIFVFLGDEQNLQEQVSTFTAQIEYFKKAWPSMNSKTLVILDEFGAGTDPSQGAALAQAVIDSLMENQIWTIAATHFPALKAYGLRHEQVRAASVLFDPETNTPMYQLAYDQVGASQALDVARDHGMPQKILQRAEELLLLDGQDSSQFMNRLNELALQREQEIKALQEQKNDLAKEKRRLQYIFNEQLKKLMQDVQDISQSIVHEWKEGKIGRKQALKELHRQKTLLEGQKQECVEEEKNTLDIESIAEGQNIYYPVWKKFGQILEKDQRKNKIKVNLDGVRIWLCPQEVTTVQDQEQGCNTLPIKSHPKAIMSMRLDLRGQRVEEAQRSIQRFLDNACLYGQRELEIIHGRGTGVLRHLVYEILREHQEVVSFAFASEKDGGDGVTLVEMRQEG
jgi:DNA mismatch repair protein MutS2